MHAERQQHLLLACSDPPPIVHTVLRLLREAAPPLAPIVLEGPAGCGTQTVASHLASELADLESSMVVTRFLTLTPESLTVMTTLFTVLEQVAIAFAGGSPALTSLKVGKAGWGFLD